MSLASGWFTAGSKQNINATKGTGYTFSSWSTANVLGKIKIAKNSKSKTIATISGAGTVYANFIPTVKASLTVKEGSVAPGGSTKIFILISRGPQSVTLTNTTVPAGVTIQFANNLVTDGLKAAKDPITFSTTASVAPGIYAIDIVATCADGQQAIVAYTLTVT